MSVLEDITGQTFGILTAVKYVGSTSEGRAKWEFSCGCGNTIIATTKSVKRKNGRTSCGCLNKSISHGHTRGGKPSKTYKSWHCMIQRCLNQNNKFYPHYGGRGITVCSRWLNSFSYFLEDMGEKPEGMSIERINNDDGYYPDNCKWATAREQILNKRFSRNSSGYRGVTKRRNKWVACITIRYETKTLGSFDSLNLAVKARNEFILKNNLEHEYPIQAISKDTQ